ncbi:MAG: ECF transporter S component [Eubacteriales bacterium]|nr:ECF transporter S component [Eubacteriales bacterium]
MKKQTHAISVHTLSLTAMFAALTLLATSVLKIPTPTFGYLHIGDTFVLLSGIFLGPLWGPLAAGLGSALSDLLGGYVLWVPGTFVIKYLTALTASVLFSRFRQENGRQHLRLQTPLLLLSGILGEAVMVAGYFFYNILIVAFSTGTLNTAGFAASAAASAAEIPFNLVQGTCGVVLTLVLYPMLRRLPANVFLVSES